MLVPKSFCSRCNYINLIQLEVGAVHKFVLLFLPNKHSFARFRFHISGLCLKFPRFFLNHFAKKLQIKLQVTLKFLTQDCQL